MKRILLLAAGAVLLGAALAAFLLWTNVDAATRLAIEAIGSRATGTRVTVKAATISLRTATGRISGLVVANPDGYKTASALELGDIEVAIDPSTLHADPVVVKELVIDGVGSTYELATRGSNIGQIRAHVSQFAAEVANVFGGSDRQDRKFIVDDLYVRGGHVALSATALHGKSAGHTLPDLHLHGLGRDTGGLTTAQLTAAIVDAVTGSVLRSVADAGIDVVNDGLHAVKGAGGSVVSKARGLLHR